MRRCLCLCLSRRSNCLSVGVFQDATLNAKVRTLAITGLPSLSPLSFVFFSFILAAFHFAVLFLFTTAPPPFLPSFSLTHSVFLSLSPPPPPPALPLPLLFLSLFPPLTCSLNLSFPFPPLLLLPSFFIFQPLHLISVSVSLPPLLPRPQLFLFLSIPPSLPLFSLTHTCFQIHTLSLSYSFLTISQSVSV